MYAKTLEHALLTLLRDADLCRVEADDIAQRFETLRGSALLPMGRENRGAHLTSDQVANAILGLPPLRPTWAANASAVLGRLLPIGGPDPQRLAEPSLRALVARLIDDPTAREHLVSLHLSVSECGMNSNGRAWVIQGPPGARRVTDYVSEMATSALHGGPQAHDGQNRWAPVSRDLVFNARFFSELAREIERARHFPEPQGDGSEYDADDARRARMIKLKYGANARFLNMAVETEATWPKEETLAIFDGVRLVLMPPTRDTVTSIHIDLAGNGITPDQAETVIRRFLSVLAWEDDQYAVLGYGWSGNPVPVPVPASNLAFATATHWFGPERSANTDPANRALAHYRAGRNAEHAGLISYAVLSFYKVLEVKFRLDERMAKWIARTLPVLRERSPDDGVWTRFDAARGDQAPELYIKNAYRVAAAHASTKTPSDEDDTIELSRLYTGADVLRRLARELITEKVGIEALLSHPPA